MKNKKLIIIIAAIVVVLIAGIIVAAKFIDPAGKAEEPEVTEAPVTPTPEPTATPEPTEEPTPTPAPTPTPVPQEIDFAAWWEKNEEVIAYITVDGTAIDYPVLCRPTDDTYYHNHTIEGKEAVKGAIYIQGSLNDMNFNDFLTVMYGHNMKNGSMFASLHEFEDEDFFNEHDTVVIYTPNRRLTYKIFAAYKRDNKHQLGLFGNDTHYSSVEARQAYIDEMLSHEGYFRDGVTVTTDDRILSMSTCIGDTNYRYVVQAVLIEDVYAVETEGVEMRGVEDEKKSSSSSSTKKPSATATPAPEGETAGDEPTEAVQDEIPEPDATEEATAE